MTQKRRYRPFALRECDLNRLDGNISTFSDGFLTNVQFVKFHWSRLTDRQIYPLLYNRSGVYAVLLFFQKALWTIYAVFLAYIMHMELAYGY